MSATSTSDITQLLRQWRCGDRGALDVLTPLVYDELHRIAARCLRDEHNLRTLQPTALIGEVYVRLMSGEPPSAESRTHFIALAARLMRQVLVDHARRRDAGKRGGGQRAVTLEETLLPAARPSDLVVLSEVLEQLAAFDERKASIVELCHFGGLTQEEIADSLGVHVNTVARDLRLAHAWLRDRLQGTG